MERVAEAIRAGTSVARAAARVGYAPGHRFRAAFAAQFARTPSRYAQMVRYATGTACSTDEPVVDAVSG